MSTRPPATASHNPWYIDRPPTTGWERSPLYQAGTGQAQGPHQPARSAPWHPLTYFWGFEASPFGTGQPLLAHRENSRVVSCGLHDDLRPRVLNTAWSLRQTAKAHGSDEPAILFLTNHDDHTTHSVLTLLRMQTTGTTPSEEIQLQEHASSRLVVWSFPQQPDDAPPREATLSIGYVSPQFGGACALQTITLAPFGSCVARYYLRFPLLETQQRPEFRSLLPLNGVLVPWGLMLARQQFGFQHALHARDTSTKSVKSIDIVRESVTPTSITSQTLLKASLDLRHQTLRISLHRPADLDGAFPLSNTLATLWYLGMGTAPAQNRQRWNPLSLSFAPRIA